MLQLPPQVTINGIRFVIDSGFVKVRRFVPATGFDSLQVTQGQPPTSSENQRQTRRGSTVTHPVREGETHAARLGPRECPLHLTIFQPPSCHSVLNDLFGEWLNSVQGAGAAAGGSRGP